jgi:hypothetical protein
MTAPPRPRVIGLPAQRGANPQHDPSGRPAGITPGCGCTWLLAGTDPAVWRRTETNPLCRVHGSSHESGNTT